MTAPTAPSRRPDDRGFRRALAGLYGLSFLVVGLLVVRGWPYYTTPLAQRPHHPDYRLYGPGGLIGHGMGVVGSALMVLLLLYSLRKRYPPRSRLGSPRKWLSLHIYCGVMGPLLVILHSTFTVGGLVAVSFWSMIAVAASGILGRYFYQRIPRNLFGIALAPDEIAAVVRRQEEALMQGHALSRDELDALIRAGCSGGSWVPFIGEWRSRRGVRAALAAHRPGTGDADRQTLEERVQARAFLERRRRGLARIRSLFHYWHVVHKPFAVVMLVIMVIHAGVAVALGYTWIF